MNPPFAEYADLILDWHSRFGLDKAKTRWENKETLFKYQTALEQFLQRRKKPDPQLVSDIAHCQSSGIFEAFFSEELPSPMLRKFGGSIPELNRATLGQVARLIIAAEQFNDKEETAGSDPLFGLNPEWAKLQSSLKPSSKRVFARNIQGAVTKEFAQEFAKLAQQGLGGLKLLVALHESARHYANQPQQDLSSFTVYAPAAFGLQLASGTGTLIEAIASGRIRIGKVVVGVKQDSTDGKEPR